MLRYRTIQQVMIAMPQGDFGSTNLAGLQRFERETRAMVELSRFTRLVVDLGELRYFGAGFVGVLSRLCAETKAYQGQMALCGVSPDCFDVLRQAGVENVWPIYPNAQTAIRAMA